MGFDVTFGRYQGTTAHIGFDGHWRSPTGFHIVVEVKTSDVFAIKTKTLIGYVDALISEQKIPNWDTALGLYLVGRPDAGLQQLDNAIVAEKRTDQLRILSIESLLALADMMDAYDVSHQDVLALLRPSGPRIDPVVNLITSLLASQPLEGTTAPQSQVAPVGGMLFPAPQVSAPVISPVVSQEVTELSNSAPVYWLTPVKSDEEGTAEECIQQLVGEEHIYAFGHHTPGRKHVKPGDWICFYATTKGVIAHACVATTPELKPHPKVAHPDDFPWVFSVVNPTLYLHEPVVVNADLRAKLDAFQGKNLNNSWAWFVQATHRVSEYDFKLLTNA